jgi:hypothetical protein
MDKKLKHLEMIQAVISRMAGNSFLLKGWSITLTAAVFALASNKDSHALLVLVALLPVIMFWWLDGFFLHQERLFRELYDHVRLMEEDKIDFSMDTSPFQDSVKTVSQIIWSTTLKNFHLPVATIVGFVFILLLIYR